MSTRTLIGVPEPGGAYTARYLHWGDHPTRLMPVLRRIWQDTFAHNTAAFIQVLLAHDWSDLHPTPRRRPGGQPVVAGVGHTSTDGGPLIHDTLTATIDGCLEWLYLVDVATHTVTVYEATCHQRWLHHSVQFLTA